MMAPALRAALMAMLSMGWSACDMGQPGRREGPAGRKERGGARGAADNGHFTRPLMPAPHAPDPTRFILIGTSHPGNVGAAARAIKVMGFSELWLVAPRDPLAATRDEAVAMASGATDTLAATRVVATLAEALDGVDTLCATAMTPRDFGPPTFAPRELFSTLAPSAQRVAFVFGSERFGMANEDVYRCHACLSIPTRADYVRSTSPRRCN